MNLREQNDALRTDDLYNSISNALENCLYDIYKKNNIITHDVTPEQYLEWDRCVVKCVKLFDELYRDNFILTKRRMTSKAKPKKSISIEKDEDE